MAVTAVAVGLIAVVNVTAAVPAEESTAVALTAAAEAVATGQVRVRYGGVRWSSASRFNSSEELKTFLVAWMIRIFHHATKTFLPKTPAANPAGPPLSESAGSALM